MNLLELKTGVVHADCPGGNDYTLCGITAENIISSRKDYDPYHETETEPAMLKTSRKITCPDCAGIIRYCVALGTKAIAGNDKTKRRPNESQ